LLRANASGSSWTARRIGLGVWLCCVVIAACGSGAPAKPVAERVCEGARTAAAMSAGESFGVRIQARDAANLRCLLSGRRLRIRLVSQASTRAYTEFDTETSHQSQVYGPGVHEPGQIPVPATVRGAVVAVWIPAQREIVATDATPTTAGAYVTVSLAGRASPARSLALTRAVARATFAAHPDAAAS
jgi:hypothetical protein